MWELVFFSEQSKQVDDIFDGLREVETHCE